MNRDTIEKYARGAEELALAIRGLTEEDLLCVPAADAGVGLWSIKQVVIHLMDSDLIAIDRMKRMIAMENPLLVGYDEKAFASKLFYDEQSAQDALTILELSFRNFAKVLRKLPDSAFERAGTHNERGPVKLGHYLKSMIDHMEHHIKFIHAKRAKMGKEMW